jgi:hypothetical protein
MICWGGGNGAANYTNWIFNAPAVNWCCHQKPHKIQRFCLFALLAVKMPAAAYGQMSAGWVRNHQIPAVGQYLFDWLL